MDGCQSGWQLGSELPKKNDAQIGWASLDEKSLAALDHAAETRPFQIDLLQTAPAREVRGQIEVVVNLLEKLDQRALLSKQNWISRLIGADVEARLEFELSAQNVMIAVGNLKLAAENGKQLILMLSKAREDIIAEQARFDQVIEAGQALLAANPNAEKFIAARFERRLANIMALYTANTLTLEQLRLATDIMASLLDRFTDVETVLLPLWQRNLVALVHASSISMQRQAATEFSASNLQLIKYLKQETNHDHG